MRYYRCAYYFKDVFLGCFLSGRGSTLFYFSTVNNFYLLLNKPYTYTLL